jgi:hypothetical protein
MNVTYVLIEIVEGPHPLPLKVQFIEEFGYISIQNKWPQKP